MQYLQLNALLVDLRAAGSPLAVLGVPCNQFGHQEPAANRTELLAGLQHVRPGSGFQPLFNLTGRADVNGPAELELFTYLKSKCPPPLHASYPKEETFWDPIKYSDIVWNFEKFLVSSSGEVLFRFMPDVEPDDIRPLFFDLSTTGDNLNRLLETMERTVGERVSKRERHKRYRHH